MVDHGSVGQRLLWLTMAALGRDCCAWVKSMVCHGQVIVEAGDCLAEVTHTAVLTALSDYFFQTVLRGSE